MKSFREPEFPRRSHNHQVPRRAAEAAELTMVIRPGRQADRFSWRGISGTRLCASDVGAAGGSVSCLRRIIRNWSRRRRREYGHTVRFASRRYRGPGRHLIRACRTISASRTATRWHRSRVRGPETQIRSDPVPPLSGTTHACCTDSPTQRPRARKRSQAAVPGQRRRGVHARDGEPNWEETAAEMRQVIAGVASRDDTAGNGRFQLDNSRSARPDARQRPRCMKFGAIAPRRARPRIEVAAQ
jgi:hypothetical protein